MFNLKENMYHETATIRAEVEISNDIAMAQHMFHMLEDGLDPYPLGYGRPFRVSLFNEMVKKDTPLLTPSEYLHILN